MNYRYEFYRYFYMDLYESKEFVRQCAAVRQCEQCELQCVAVRAVRGAVCDSAHGSMRAVRTAVFLVVYGSAHGSVRLSGSAAAYGSAAVCGNAAVCGSTSGCVWQYCHGIVRAVCAAE